MARVSPVNEEPIATDKEAENPYHSYKLSRLFLTCGPYVTRELFLQHVQNTDGCCSVQDFLAAKEIKEKITALKNNKKVLKQTQFDTIYPAHSEEIDLKSWDLSLLLIVLVHCFELQYIDSNYVQKIREYRSYLFGKTSGFSISDSEFEQKWEELSNFFLESANSLLSDEHGVCVDRLIKEVGEEASSSEDEKQFLLECHKWLQEVGEEGKQAKGQSVFKGKISFE